MSCASPAQCLSVAFALDDAALVGVSAGAAVSLAVAVVVLSAAVLGSCRLRPLLVVAGAAATVFIGTDAALLALLFKVCT